MNTATTKTTPSQPKVLTGVVVSTKMQKTAVVEVSRFVQHPKYRKFMEKTKKYQAHDAESVCKEGETVKICECRPISKNKHFTVVRDEVTTAK